MNCGKLNSGIIIVVGDKVFKTHLFKCYTSNKIKDCLYLASISSWITAAASCTETIFSQINVYCKRTPSSPGLNLSSNIRKYVSQMPQLLE